MSSVSTAAQQRWSVPPFLTSARVLRTEVLAALVVGVALIPEAISFSIIAHVDPRVGLFASFTMAATIAIVGGRPAMISAATGSTALVIAPLSQKYGLDYLVAAVILAGAIQIVLGAVGVANLMRYVPRSVSTGFVNALAILLFKAQFENLTHVPSSVYVLVAGGLVIIGFFPRISTVIPAPLVAIVILTAITVGAGMSSVPTVGDKGKLPSSLPSLGLPDVPFTGHTLSLIALPAFTMAIVGLLETQMTARLVDDLTDTGSNKHRESWGQGIANVITGFFGGMGGCAMIGQTMINIKSGARSRLSTFLAGVFLLIMVVVLGPVVSDIPMAALVAVMFIVSYSTFDWRSIKPAQLKRMPGSETVVMLITVILTVWTGNLSIGVMAGVIVAALLFARRVTHVSAVHKIAPEEHSRHHLHLPHLHMPHVHGATKESGSAEDRQAGDVTTATMRHISDAGEAVEAAEVSAVTDPGGNIAVYAVTGELFFASSSDLTDKFDYAGDPDRVIIDLTDSHIWDATSVAALDQVVEKYSQRGKTVELIGMNTASAQFHGNLAGHLGSSH